jgi:SanA protein
MRKILNVLVFLMLASLLAFVFLQVYVNQSSQKWIYTDLEKVPKAYTGIVLGASVLPDKSLSPILQARVDAALQAYQQGKIQRFLLSGDHGQDDYDEVNPMKDYLMARGVPAGDIFMDHAGFDTYDSMIRARDIFKVDRAVVFTQDFHLPRAIYIGRQMDLEINGYVADAPDYKPSGHLVRREWLANIKAWTELHIKQRPTYSGEQIPIRGNSEASHDQ